MWAVGDQIRYVVGGLICHGQHLKPCGEAQAQSRAGVGAQGLAQELGLLTKLYNDTALYSFQSCLFIVWVRLGRASAQVLPVLFAELESQLQSKTSRDDLEHRSRQVDIREQHDAAGEPKFRLLDLHLVPGVITCCMPRIPLTVWWRLCTPSSACF